MEEQVLVFYDSGIDVDHITRSKEYVHIVPNNIKLDDNVLIDNDTINTEEIFQYYNNTHKLPCIIPPNSHELFSVFTRFIHTGCHVIYFTTSKTMFPNYDNGISFATAYNKLHVVDTLSIGIGAGLLIHEVCKLIDSGEKLYTILSDCTMLACKNKYMIYQSNLQYISKQKLFKFNSTLLTLMGKIPVIEIKEGKVDLSRHIPLNRYTMYESFLTDSIAFAKEDKPTLLLIGYTDLSEEVRTAFKEFINNELFGAEVIFVKQNGFTSVLYGENSITFAWNR